MIHMSGLYVLFNSFSGIILKFLNGLHLVWSGGFPSNGFANCQIDRIWFCTKEVTSKSSCEESYLEMALPQDPLLSGWVEFR